PSSGCRARFGGASWIATCSRACNSTARCSPPSCSLARRSCASTPRPRPATAFSLPTQDSRTCTSRRCTVAAAPASRLRTATSVSPRKRQPPAPLRERADERLHLHPRLGAALLPPAHFHLDLLRDQLHHRFSLHVDRRRRLQRGGGHSAG